jgi:hypothetical protein
MLGSFLHLSTKVTSPKSHWYNCLSPFLDRFDMTIDDVDNAMKSSRYVPNGVTPVHFEVRRDRVERFP